MFHIHRSHSLVGMSSSPILNTQSQSSYMSAGSNPGADVVNFRFHITDFNASLQSSSVVSVENDQMVPGGNKGAIVTEKTEKMLEQCQAALDDVNKYLAGSRGCKMRVMEELKRLIGDDCDCDDCCGDTQWGVCVGCGYQKIIYSNCGGKIGCSMCVECFT